MRGTVGRDRAVTIIEWLWQHPGFYTAAEIAAATGYTERHTKNTLNWLAKSHKVIRAGAAYVVNQKYAAVRYDEQNRLLLVA